MVVNDKCEVDICIRVVTFETIDRAIDLPGVVLGFITIE